MISPRVDLAHIHHYQCRNQKFKPERVLNVCPPHYTSARTRPSKHREAIISVKSGAQICTQFAGFMSSYLSCYIVCQPSFIAVIFLVTAQKRF